MKQALKSGNSAVRALRGRGRRLERFHKDCAFKTEGHATISSVIGLNDLELFYVTEKAMVTCLKLFSRRLV